jgi:agmatine deiminase
MAQGEFAGLVDAVARDETVCVMAFGEELRKAETALGGMDRVEIHDVPTNDAWARDYGPTFVRHAQSGQRAAVHWQYNAWGGKYPPFDDDQRVPRRIAEALGIRRFEVPAVVEGGAIDVNGAGQLLTTRSCLLDPRRNPGADSKSMARVLRDYGGVGEVVWLAGDAILGDDTDGHIDQLARWINDQTIVYAWTDQPGDPQRPRLEANLADLRDALGDRVRLVPLPLPKPVLRGDSRLPASYLNFLITNGSVLVPQFGDRRADSQALEILDQSLGPTRSHATVPDAQRRVVGLPSLFLSVGFGSFHCLTQQEPA